MTGPDALTGQLVELAGALVTLGILAPMFALLTTACLLTLGLRRR